MPAELPSAPASYRLSKTGLEDLRRMEAMRMSVYDDKTGKNINSYEEAQGYPTIGLGLLIDSAEKREKYRPYLGGRKADPNWMWEQSLATVRYFESALNRQLAGVALTQSMFDALFSLAWNTGAASRYVKKVIEQARLKDYVAAAKAIATGPITSKGKVMEGLVKRRAREAALFMAEGVPGGLDTLLGTSTFMLYGAAALGSLVVLRMALRRRKRRAA